MSDIHTILIHYLDGTATLEEKQLLLDWLNSSEENQKEFQEIRDLWLGSNATLHQETPLEALEKFRSRIFASLHKREKKQHKTFQTFMRVASIFILAFTLNYGLFTYLYKQTSQEKTTIVNRLITSEQGKGCFVLPDSTIVWLNKNSTLVYPEHFDKESRQVKLQGEAYFQVHKDTEKPFWVEANDITVEVTGTSFVLQSYEHRKNIETILIDGEVIVGNPLLGKTALKPNQRFSFDKTAESFQIDSINALNYIGWINNRLEFDNARLSDILTQMGEWYGVDIVYPANYAHKTRMTFMVRDESIEEILNAIQMIIPIRYHREEHTIYIKPRK